jgi:hypothetical protein
MFSVARSSGRPTRLLRSASTMNSSISLPTWRDMPRMMLPMASASVSVPFMVNSTGFRKAWIRPMSLDASVGSRRATVSVSIEWPKRYTTLANSSTMAGLMVGELEKTNGSMVGATPRANSSNTRCWYCISVAKRPAWNSRSPSHTRPRSGRVGGSARSAASGQVGRQPLVEVATSPDPGWCPCRRRPAGCAPSGRSSASWSGRCSRCRGRRRWRSGGPASRCRRCLRPAAGTAGWSSLTGNGRVVVRGWACCRSRCRVGVSSLPRSSTGAALCAMSIRNWWSVRKVSAGSRVFPGRRWRRGWPSTRPCAVTIWAKPFARG